MKIDSGKLSAVMADYENIVNDARKIEGLEKEGIDPVKKAKEIFHVKKSVILEIEDLAKEFNNTATSLVRLQGVSTMLETTNPDVSKKIDDIKKNLLTNFAEKYSIDLETILEEV